MKKSGYLYRTVFVCVVALTAFPKMASAEFWSDETLLSETDSLPFYQKDRGTGIPLSMFGTYVKKGQIYIYPFLEYYRDKDFEYKPEELGYGVDEDYFGKYRATEGLIFLGYGITDWLAVEIEAAVIKAKLEKSDDDISQMPNTIEESGLGDVEGQIRWRWFGETERRPELFSYFETVFPLQKDKVLIGTQDWEFKLGAGIAKGFRFGTMTVRVAGEYDRSEDKFEMGEFALEYLKKLSRHWRIYLGTEGTQDEVEAITEVQLHLNRHLFFKFNNAFGVTKKATDWAPEVGVVFSF